LFSNQIIESELGEVNAHKRKKHKGKRDEFYNGLQTEQIVHELPESERVCPECGGDLHACGHEVVRCDPNPKQNNQHN